MKTISLRAVANALPETRVPNNYFGTGNDPAERIMFKGAKERRHVARGETATDLIAQAVEQLQDELGKEYFDDVDIILTNVSIPDLPFTGCGAEVAKRLGIQPSTVYDLHNHGCVAFVSMIPLAQSLMTTMGAKKALLCNVQTAAGRVFSHDDVRVLPQAAIPGDGCGVAVLEEGDFRPILGTAVRCHPEYASDMQLAGGEGARWWEPRESQFRIDFSRATIAKVVERGNALVPEAVEEALASSGEKGTPIDVLVTNQPNPVFLRNWRDALGVDESGHVDTFAEYGNLFGAGIPVSLKRAMDENRIEEGDLVALGGFSHAGDYSAAAIVRWGKAA